MKPCYLCEKGEVLLLGTKDDRDVGECNRCNLVQTMEVPEGYLDLYTQGTTYHEGREGHQPYKERFDHDSRVAETRVNKLLSWIRILDVGSANGAFVFESYLAGMDSEGFELNPEMAAWSAYKTRRHIHTGWDTVIPPYDFITYHDVIEHCSDPIAEMKRAGTYLTSDGMLVLDTPDTDDSRFDELGMDWHHMKPREHLFFFNENTLRAALSKAGFVTVAVDRPIEGKIVLYARKKVSQ